MFLFVPVLFRPSVFLSSINVIMSGFVFSLSFIILYLLLTLTTLNPPRGTFLGEKTALLETMVFSPLQMG